MSSTRAVIFMLLASVSGVAAQMTHEETVVRTAYAKFAYAVQQGAIVQLGLEANHQRSHYKGKATNDQRLAAAEVTFTLRDFVIGNMRDILDRKAMELITPAQGEILEIIAADYGFAGLDTRMHWFDLHWQQVTYDMPPEILSLTMADAYRMQWRQEMPETLLQRYALYTVIVTYQGKSRGPYNALFIFGHDAKGNEVVEPEDPTAGQGALVSALHESLFPDGLVLTRLRTYPVVADWLNAHQMSDAACSVGKHDLCCDLVKMRCGPGRVDVTERSLEAST